MPFVKKPIKKIRKIFKPQEVECHDPEVVSRPSNSRLSDLYKNEAFRTELANDLHFHVAINILHLRRHRGISQKVLAEKVGTSQSAIARIENGQENLTIDTLRRIVTALGGRSLLTIPPQELAPRRFAGSWWETTGRSVAPALSADIWRVCDVIFGSVNEKALAIVALESDNRV